MKRDMQARINQSHGRLSGQCAVLGVVILTSLFLAGCKGIPTKGEKAIHHDLDAVAKAFRPPRRSPALPTLTTNSVLADLSLVIGGVPPPGAPVLNPSSDCQINHTTMEKKT